MLGQLNTTLGTSHTLDTPSLSSLLEECIAKNWNFGMAYSRLRRIWYTRNWSTVRDTLREWEEADREMRRKALVGNRIVKPDLPPRRVWDLCSNRVVPYWCMGIPTREMVWRLRPISHAWMDETHRVNMSTPINGCEWPVPMPKDASLNLVRIEMLNLRAEYVWLDVLCLRQVGRQQEDMRVEEWKLDVPTIGAVYDASWDVVIYLSGLGRPLTLKEGDLDSDRCWFRRAWTLQEVGIRRVIAGDTPDGPLHAKRKNRKYKTALLTRFHKQLRSTEDISNTKVFDVLKEMQTRVSTNPVDKVAGLAFLVRSRSIPAYYESESFEDAWTALVNLVPVWSRGRLFLSYPEPGNAGTKWRPSWDQLMMMHLPADTDPGIYVDRNEEMGEDWCDAECIEKGLVRGLAVVEGSDRHGELIVKDAGETEHAFNVTATHEYPIPDDTYTLFYAGGWLSQYCVIGRRLPGKRFEKVSVLEIPDRDEWRRLEDLRIMKKCRNVLV
ncbi:uncharacterized protein EV420DRAFT_1308276 [Desarmillaria tabescens]|uniref:Heterokaryon incompatibility domain-containing protein n=1 Tax=Armillaria tabescens TaxID=1929756 RepID=A0AA39KD34_ARMTA|nr:uncharacterized protein EV420DRAFT_1308276 [Desarmillaria tabescens]KAK0458772.1 hypothetical protein EV420DRAFT_1308276 [Desarmillaria tabescens]